MSSTPPKLSLHKIATLPKPLQETSGLIFYKDTLWTIVDDTYPILYGINPTNGKRTKTIRMASSDNNDMESLTQNDQSIFVGDIGNNRGNRKNLRVYAINKTSIEKQWSRKNITVKTTALPFHYPYQTSFSNTPYQHNYDSEAMLASNDTLTLINKNWQGKSKTQLYRMTIQNQPQALEPYAQIQSDMLITGATQQGSDVWFIGYQLGGRLQPYIEHFVISDHRFKRIKQWKLPLKGQFEAIAIGPQNTLYLTCESDASQPASLFRVSIDALND